MTLSVDPSVAMLEECETAIRALESELAGMGMAQLDAKRRFNTVRLRELKEREEVIPFAINAYRRRSTQLRIERHLDRARESRDHIPAARTKADEAEAAWRIADDNRRRCLGDLQTLLVLVTNEEADAQNLRRELLALEDAIK